MYEPISYIAISRLLLLSIATCCSSERGIFTIQRANWWVIRNIDFVNYHIWLPGYKYVSSPNHIDNVGGWQRMLNWVGWGSLCRLIYTQIIKYNIYIKHMLQMVMVNVPTKVQISLSFVIMLADNKYQSMWWWLFQLLLVQICWN